MHDGPHSSTQHHSVPRSLLGTAHPPHDLSKPRGGGQNMPGPRGRAVCSSGTQRRRAEASTGACRFNPSNYKAAYKYLLGASLPLLFDVVLLFTSNPLLLLLFLSSLLPPPFHGCLRAALQKQLRKEAGKSLGARDSQTPARSLPAAKPRMRALPRLCSLQHPSGAELRRSELKPCTPWLVEPSLQGLLWSHIPAISPCFCTPALVYAVPGPTAALTHIPDPNTFRKCWQDSWWPDAGNAIRSEQPSGQSG